MRSLILVLGGLLCLGRASGQSTATGRVVSDSAGFRTGIAGISIYVRTTGQSVKTDVDGYFTFTASGTEKMELVARFSSDDSDVFVYHPPIAPLLVKNHEVMKAIQVKIRRSGSHVHSRGPQKIEILNEGEFKKAACCTLSESFETNNTVEVSNADGVSGIRQVEMLGLSGKYVLMTRGNMPLIRGLNVLTGLNHIPGPMVGGVHIAKGVGPVTNGYEGISGGLNYALKAEPTDPKLFLNGYINGQSRTEGNLILKQNLSKRAFNHAYLHYGTQFQARDMGKDGFSDLPLFQRVYLGDEMTFYGKKTEGSMGISYVNEQRKGGDMRSFSGNNNDNHFQFTMDEKRAEAFAKLGIFLNEDGSKSFGNILYATHTQSETSLNNLRNRTYSGTQKTVSYTGIYGSPDEEKWSVKSGVNILFDQVSETYKDSGLIQFNPSRNELSTGAFGEMVYKGEILTVVTGARVDWNNLYGLLLTPRLHVKYDITKQQQIHLQVGLGRRTAWIFAENLPLLISNRSLIIETAPVTGFNGKTLPGAYGLPQEKAWNGGISYTRHFMLFQFPSSLSFDAYYTWFITQVVADRDEDPSKLIVRSQSGNQTTMAQVDWDVKPHRRVELKLSYRYVNSQMFLGGASRLQTMQAPHRALFVVNYNTRSKWFFDMITQVNSPKRLPLTQMLKEEYRMPEYSPWYTIVNVQVRKEIKRWEIYAGCENVLNVLQKNPVLNTPEFFDAAFAWGPTMGRNVFLGFRYAIK